jgi:hypothetical protein
MEVFSTDSPRAELARTGGGLHAGLDIGPLEFFTEVYAVAKVEHRQVGEMLRQMFVLGRLPDSLVEILIVRGATLIEKKLRNDPEVLAKIKRINPHYEEEMEALNRQTAQDIARKPKTAKQLERERAMDQVNAEINQSMEHIAAALKFYESFRLSDGTLLRDADRSKLALEAEKEKAMADCHIGNFDFYSSLVKRMSADQIVSQVFKPHEIANLRARYGAL